MNYEDRQEDIMAPPATAGVRDIISPPRQLEPLLPPCSALPAVSRINRLLTFTEKKIDSIATGRDRYEQD